MSQQSLKRKWTLCLLLCWGIVAVYAQSERLLKFEITTFQQDQQATTATSEQYGKRDASGSWYAIIKFMSEDPTVKIDNLDAFTFDFGNMKHMTEIHGDELWIYVQKNARTVTIRRDGYAPIKKWDLKTTIREGATYVMKITFDKVTWNVERSLNKQPLQIQLEPKISGAVVKLTRENERTPMETMVTDPTGSVGSILKFGTYFYDVEVPNYKKASGRVKLTTSDSVHVETVKLIPNFGYLEIQDPGNAAGAKVFVNGKEVGVVPYKSDTKWDCNTYELLLVKELYKSYTTNFTINRGETTVIKPQLESNFAETTLTVEGNADIYIDGILKGKGRWAGPLKAGTYLVECRKANHRKTQKEINVEVDVASTITLPPPIPITGFLSVNSTPVGAHIKIDGKDYGVTPRIIQDLLIGQHKVEVSMDNRKTEVREVNIEEGKEEQLSVNLSSTALISFSSMPRGASVLIDGTLVGTTPFTKEMASGNYEIKGRAYGYRPYHRKMYIDVAHPAVHFKMSRQLMKRNAFYVGADGQFGALAAVGGTMGFYAGNVNVEGFYMKGFGKETVFWNSTGENVETDFSTEEGNKPWAEEELKIKTVAGGRFGYGFILGTRFRMTPQLGCVYVGAEGDKGTSVYALSGTGGLRLEVACTSHVGISVTPEYAFKLAEADGYKLLSSVIPAMKDWNTGFNCKVGVYFFF